MSQHTTNGPGHDTSDTSDAGTTQDATGRARLTAVPGLARIPGPPPRDAAPEPDPAGSPTPAADADKHTPSARATAATPRTGRTSSPTAPAPSASTASTGATRDMSFTAPLSIRTALRAAASRPETTKAAVVLAAIEANAHRLAELVDAERSPAQPGATSHPGRLFPDPAMAPRHSGEPRVPESLRLTERNLHVLDQLVTSCGAENRSQLLTAALRAALRGTQEDNGRQEPDGQ